jgi:hypothetical protein
MGVEGGGTWFLKGKLNTAYLEMYGANGATRIRCSLMKQAVSLGSDWKPNRGRLKRWAQVLVAFWLQEFVNLV